MADSPKDVFEKLMKVNLDAFEGFRTASDNSNDKRLTTVFDQTALERKKFARYWASRLDDPSYKTDLKADLHRFWMDLKTGSMKFQATRILKECKKGEKHALKTYEELEKSDLGSEELEELNQQKRQIAAMLDQLDDLLNTFEKRDTDRNQDMYMR